jgi:hypothetical protein
MMKAEAQAEEICAIVTQTETTQRKVKFGGISAKLADIEN